LHDPAEPGQLLGRRAFIQCMDASSSAII